ncbi:YjbE family putative metal transport protein [Clostridium estertheticum]|uniref:YjbE family putative metal transport protein n=1 Tax=Clostridium estertheticum TaxID=238834 RepID=UPI001C0C17CE|nr:YjbE family putative metal transport protein [Clostridium estertheticum]MBU3185148.1 YjbE family putative metal transport protein [Clostridium estertheticum]MCB2339978.1 YjbE family putative metal transport protein [Clostridium estertheticum]
MESLVLLIIGILKITILDLTLSGDNIGVIALATKKLPPAYAKKASLIGITGAIGLRIVFACIITLIMNIQWLHIKLVGGLFLVKITWDFIKPEAQEDDCTVKKAGKFWEAVAIIIIADISMSLDNVIAIASAANGSVLLIIVGILINVPIIFFGSQIVANLMRKHPIVIYLGGGILAHTSLKMILEDNLTTKYIEIAPAVLTIIPWIFAISILVYGFLMIKKSKIELGTNQ